MFQNFTNLHRCKNEGPQADGNDHVNANGFTVKAHFHLYNVYNILNNISKKTVHEL